MQPFAQQNLIIVMNMLSRLLAILFVVIIAPNFAYALNNCFIAKENSIIVKQIGKCDTRHSPFSSFKLALAVMGFDSGILISEKDPKVRFTPEIEKQYVTYYNPEKYPTMFFWKRNQTPKSWMRDSVVWYSRYITHQLGKEKFQEYIDKFDYGNRDVSGGLMEAWLGNSLKISPLEQVEFLDKLVKRDLPASKEAQEKAMNLAVTEVIHEGFKMHGKTGGGINGWFIGWVEKEDRLIVFAQYVEQSEDHLISGGKMAKELAKDNLITLLMQ